MALSISTIKEYPQLASYRVRVIEIDGRRRALDIRQYVEDAPTNVGIGILYTGFTKRGVRFSAWAVRDLLYRLQQDGTEILTLLEGLGDGAKTSGSGERNYRRIGQIRDGGDQSGR